MSDRLFLIAIYCKIVNLLTLVIKIKKNLKKIIKKGLQEVAVVVYGGLELGWSERVK